jgi:hypothetical protein
MMEIKDTLTMYDELVAGGCTETQARIQAMQLGTVSNLVERIEKDLFWMRAIGAGMIVACFAVMFK